MTSRLHFTSALAPLFIALVACGGKTAGLTSPSPTPNCPTFDGEIRCSVDDDAGPVTTLDAGETKPDASPTCVDVNLADFDQSCMTDTDCLLVRTGPVCDGECSCEGGSAINVSGAAEYTSDISSIQLGLCHCTPADVARCVENQCTTCAFGPGGVTCGDAGVTGATDGGVIFPVDASPEDAGEPDAGKKCVEVNLADYSTSCTTDSDCFTIQTGEVCDGQCECGGSPVSTSGEAMYDSAISGIQFGECGCPAEPDPVCTNGQCAIPGLGG